MARVAALRANGHAPIPMTPGVSASSRRARQASRRRALWLTAASLVAVILLLVTFWTRETVTPPSPVVQAEQQARALLGAPNATIFHLQATAHGPSNALAVMAMDPSSKRGVVVTRNLPALKAGQTYEFWIVHTPAGSAGVATTPTGTFNSAADGSGSLRFTTPDNLGAVDDAGVSVEPTGGVATPDAPMLLTLASH